MSTSPHPSEDPLADFRQRFPALDDNVHLASCSQGALSMELTTALFELQHSMRAHGAPWERWTGVVDSARAAFASFINAAPEEIAVVSCASEGAYHVASTRDWAARSRIVSTDMEFPSIGHVWLAQRSRGAEVDYVGNHDGIVHAEDYLARIDGRAGLVSVPLVSYRNGVRMPVAEVTKAAHDAGAQVFVDGYQACGVVPVDVRELDCDFFVTGTLKYMLGLPGLAFLYVRGGVAGAADPQLTGWFGQEDPFTFDPQTLEPATDARRFQTGTPAIPSAYAASAGLSVLNTVPRGLVEERVGRLVGQAHDQLVADGERLWSPADPALRGPMVALVDEDPNRLAAFLAERRIHTSPRGTVLRLSFHGYNDQRDVEAVCQAVRDYRKL
ncbi:MAG TPA: aminotransferase class V-fold PLP-dependent enzyme [Marmoricola sp.]|nr:aminotransferase class V-fold PLP-dependent enzyme [Marmoricola sp.]